MNRFSPLVCSLAHSSLSLCVLLRAVILLFLASSPFVAFRLIVVVQHATCCGVSVFSLGHNLCLYRHELILLFGFDSLSCCVGLTLLTHHYAVVRCVVQVRTTSMKSATATPTWTRLRRKYKSRCNNSNNNRNNRSRTVLRRSKNNKYSNNLHSSKNCTCCLVCFVVFFCNLVCLWVSFVTANVYVLFVCEVCYFILAVSHNSLCGCTAPLFPFVLKLVVLCLCYRPLGVIPLG